MPRVVPTPALEEPEGFLFPLKFATDFWEVDVAVPEGAILCGGLPANAEERAKQPWKERVEDLRRQAQASSDTSEVEELNGEQSVLVTVFRRTPEGHLAASGNQIRTMLQEAARAAYGDQSGYYLLRRALRANLRIEPTLIQYHRDGTPLSVPDGILELPRPIRKPPFERSIIQRPEFIKGPLTFRFVVAAARIGNATVITGDVIQYLLEYSGEMVGLGAHRGLDDTVAGTPGRFAVEQFTELPPMGTQLAPKLVDPRAAKKKAAAKPASED